MQGYKIGRGDPWYRKVIGRAYHHVVRLLFGLHVRDTDCDFRLIRRSLARARRADVDDRRDLRRDDAQVPARRRPFVEVGVSHYARPHGRSQFFRLPAIARSARQLMALWWTLVVRERFRSAVAPGHAR